MPYIDLGLIVDASIIDPNRLVQDQISLALLYTCHRLEGFFTLKQDIICCYISHHILPHCRDLMDTWGKKLGPPTPTQSTAPSLYRFLISLLIKRNVEQRDQSAVV